MKLQRLFRALLVSVLALPAHGREPVDFLLQAASKALDQYQQKLAPGFHCDAATTTEFRETCKDALESLGTSVQEAKAEIAHYRQLSTPKVVDYPMPISLFGESWTWLKPSPAHQALMVNTIGSFPQKPTADRENHWRVWQRCERDHPRCRQMF